MTEEKNKIIMTLEFVPGKDMMIDMSDKKLFTDRRWTDIPLGEVIGHREITEEEKQEAEEAHRLILKQREEYKKQHQKD